MSEPSNDRPKVVPLGRPSKRTFGAIWLDAVTVDETPSYIVDGIIPSGPSFGEIPAPPKSLKSFFVTDLWLHIALGKPYAGREVQRGVAVYVTSEGVQGVKRRLVAMRRHHGVEGVDVPFLLVPAMPNLGVGAGDDCRRLIEEIKAKVEEYFSGVPVRAIAIDTLRRATPGKSENDPKDMSGFIAACETLAKEFNCFVGVVHHSPRSDITRGSGTNAIEGACDVIMTVTRSEVASPPQATVTIDRMKDGDEGLSWTFQIHSMEVGTDRERKPKFGGYVVLASEPAPKEWAAPKPKARAEPKTVCALRDAFAAALESLGRMISRPGDLLTFKAVPLAAVLEEFKLRHATDAEDGKKQADAQRQAFKRAREKLPELHEGTIDGVEYLWK